MPEVPEPESNRPRLELSGLFSRRGFRGPVLTLLSGTTVAMALSFLVLPVLTRLYTPEDFGVLNYFIAIVGILITVSSLHYDDAIMLPEEDADAANVVALAFLINLTLCLVLAVLPIWRVEIAAMLGMPEIHAWLFLVAPTLFVMRLVKLGEGWLVRSKRFRAISGGQVTNAVTMNGTRVAAGLPAIGPGPDGLIGGFLIGQTATVIVYLTAWGGHTWRILQQAVTVRRIRATAARYRRFSLFTTPSALLHTLITRLPFLLIPLYFYESSDVILGFLGQAINVFAVPLGLVGGAVSQVLYVHASEARRSGTLSGLVARVHERLVMVGLFPALVLVIAGPDLLAFVFGEPWREAGVYLRYLALWLFLAGVAAPLSRVFDVLERQRADLLTTTAMFALLTTALIIGGLSGHMYLLLVLFGGAGVLARLLHVGVILRLAQVGIWPALRPYVRYGLFGAPFLVLVYLGTKTGRVWLSVAAAGVSGIAYGLLVIWRERLLTPTSPDQDVSEKSPPHANVEQM